MVISDDVRLSCHFLYVVTVRDWGGSCRGCGRGADVDVSEAVGAVARAREDGGVVEEDGDGFSVERDVVAVVAKLRNGNKGALQSREDVGNACRMRKSGAWKETTVRSLEESSVWLRNSQPVANFLYVYAGASDHEVGGATRVYDRQSGRGGVAR